MNISRPIAGGGLALALLLGSGCSDSTEPAAPPTSSPAAGLPSPASPTSAGPTSPTSTRAGTTGAASPDLADGRHAARITRVDAAGGQITVDVVRLFLGDAAARAAQQDGSEEIPPPNDVWIRNTRSALRTLPVAPAAPITVNVHGAAESGSATKNIVKTLAELADIDGLEHGIFWLTVADGQVTRIAEQYLP
jgi:hypothetical protein